MTSTLGTVKIAYNSHVQTIYLPQAALHNGISQKEHKMKNAMSINQGISESYTKRSCIPDEPEWAKGNPYLKILAPRFFSSTSNNQWADLPKRVGRLFLAAEEKYSSHDVALSKAEYIEHLIYEGAFLPNSPVMMNSEHDNNVNLFACHVLSSPKTASDLAIAGEIHNGCGGIGYDFSNLIDPISATYSIEKETELLNPLRKRKAHSAVTLHYKHPRIIDFITMGKELIITHTNIELDNAFFTEIKNKDHTALFLWDTLCNSIYYSGRPSISFGTEKSKRSTSKLINNVCGESLLRENESSLIGSLNLTKFVKSGSFNFTQFQEAAKLGLLCLDNLHDMQCHASTAIKNNCLESRKIGIGVMGYSDALLLLNLRYGSPESLIFVDRLMTLLKLTLTDESEKLGMARGFCNSALLPPGVNRRRNASLMAIPANGTLSLLANVSGGIEPIFSYLIKQNVQGTVVYQLQPTFAKILNANKIDCNIVFNKLMAGGSIQSIKEIPTNLKKILIEANNLTTEEHIKTQAKFQSYIDGGISKTINLPGHATINDIKNAILMAKETLCVGVSLYRNGSLQDQPTQAVN